MKKIISDAEAGEPKTYTLQEAVAEAFRRSVRIVHGAERSDIRRGYGPRDSEARRQSIERLTIEWLGDFYEAGQIEPSELGPALPKP